MSIKKLTSHSDALIVSVATAAVLVGSVIFVYLISIMAGVEYTTFLFNISIILPLLLAPATLFFVLRQNRKLLYTEEHLEKEICKRKEQELVMFEQARFALMGEMLANISHQWKQPLNTINLAVVNLNLEYRYDAKQQEYFDIIEHNTNYLAETIDHFGSFFDNRKHHELKNITQITNEVQSILGITFEKQEIKLEFKNLIDADVKVAASIVQVLLNLLNNAVDAFGTDTYNDKKVLVELKLQDKNVIIKCYDNAGGVAQINKEKIFMPYFTTKQIKTGSGLGLYMSREIAQKLFDGELYFSDAKDSEYTTCFSLVVPESELCQIQRIGK